MKKDANGHFVIAYDLTRQPDAGQSFGRELFLFSHRMRRRLAFDELDATGRAAGEPSTGVQDIDSGILFNGVDQPLPGWHFECSDSVDRQFGHPIIVCGTRSD